MASPATSAAPASPHPAEASGRSSSSSSSSSTAPAPASSNAPDPSLVPEAILNSPSVDVSASTTFRINAPPTDRAVRIYCDGIYDLFHYGHAKALEQAKKAFPNVHLLVGVCNDRETHKRKGKTVMVDHERYESVRHCKWVDQVIPDAPWIITQAFIDEHQIDYVAHDDIPYAAGDVADVYAFVKAQGRFLPTKRTDGISTSDLITRIVRDYDEYLRRNLNRGVSPQELNIGYFKEKRLRVAQQVMELQTEIKSELAEWKDEWKETVKTWEDKSAGYVKGFVSMFQKGVKLLRIRSPTGSRPTSPSVPQKRRRASDDDGDDGDEGDDMDADEDGHEDRQRGRRHGDQNEEDDEDESPIDPPPALSPPPRNARQQKQQQQPKQQQRPSKRRRQG
ncbi:hypothetical protein GGF31_005380 [Allomyces arbusculus]|nr:hypothetical protein GGF31_005380 [Allomyces arbusculus]